MEIPIYKRASYLLAPGILLENIPIDQAVAFLVGYCVHADMPLRMCKIEGDEIITLNTQYRTVAECLDLLARMSGCVWSINPNGLFYFVKP